MDEGTRIVAELMKIAAITAPKAIGQDFIETKNSPALILPASGGATVDKSSFAKRSLHETFREVQLWRTSVDKVIQGKETINIIYLKWIQV